ncbi:uncharacterized protein EI90DRAFT_3038288 [Cantharellus anzutake]|uniref:uncharacterized protein n=1 Tax=Cantharellus anzutake TaxID=1750568 RepID=UPI001908283C|nr:uncharacterized protein EI90DRAFT_3038288 [Cantharellus anzutake]KAF8339907.1 hypothetical protein EI90DRAFT_3038288 [Cantharellus anzutake]
MIEEVEVPGCSRRYSSASLLSALLATSPILPSTILNPSEKQPSFLFRYPMSNAPFARSFWHDSETSRCLPSDVIPPFCAIGEFYSPAKCGKLVYDSAMAPCPTWEMDKMYCRPRIRKKRRVLLQYSTGSWDCRVFPMHFVDITRLACYRRAL